MTNHAKNYASTIYQSLVEGERPLRSGIYKVQKQPCWRAKGGAPAGTRQAKEITTETSRPRIQRYA